MADKKNNKKTNISREKQRYFDFYNDIKVASDDEW